MKNLEELVKDIERDLVVNLSIFTKYERISFDESKEIAREFIQNSPFLDYEELFEKLHNLSVKHRVVRRVYVKHAPAYFSEKGKIILAGAQYEMRLNRIDRAIKLMKSINYD